MTEDEAKTKQCRVPVMVVIGIGGAIADAQATFYKCGASDCMMWQPTDNEYYPQAQAPGDIRKQEGKPAGYCGLVRRAT
jgi:hypothetical protein